MEIENDRRKDRLDILVFQIPFYLINVVNLGMDAEK